jgi:GNAT superfamily N-acetyltransferase
MARHADPRKTHTKAPAIDPKVSVTEAPKAQPIPAWGEAHESHPYRKRAESPTYNLHKPMLTIRPATPADVPQILTFIRDLATYEREPNAVHATEADLLRDGFPEAFGQAPRFHCLIAELEDNTPVGFALYFHNYSTWRGHHGIHIEDLFVPPEHRGKGIGKALLTRVAAIAHAEGCSRLQWDVLEWNTPAIGFYEQLGAQMLMDWRTMRITNEAIPALAAQSK